MARAVRQKMRVWVDTCTGRRQWPKNQTGLLWQPRQKYKEWQTDTREITMGNKSRLRVRIGKLMLHYPYMHKRVPLYRSWLGPVYSTCVSLNFHLRHMRGMLRAVVLEVSDMALNAAEILGCAPLASETREGAQSTCSEGQIHDTVIFSLICILLSLLG